MARGKSYEGEDFRCVDVGISQRFSCLGRLTDATVNHTICPQHHPSLTWNISLGVPIGKGKGCTGGAPKTKTILDGIVGKAEKGQLVAVMGSSGAFPMLDRRCDGDHSTMAAG